MECKGNIIAEIETEFILKLRTFSSGQINPTLWRMPLSPPGTCEPELACYYSPSSDHWSLTSFSPWLASALHSNILHLVSHPHSGTLEHITTVTTKLPHTSPPLTSITATSQTSCCVCCWGISTWCSDQTDSSDCLLFPGYVTVITFHSDTYGSPLGVLFKRHEGCW